MWLVLLLLTVFLLVRRWKMQPLIQVSNEVTCSIKAYPFIGHAHLFRGGGVNRMNALQRFGYEAIKHRGMTTMWLGENCYVVTVNVTDLELITKTFLEKDNIMRFAQNLLGNGLIFAPVPIWRPRRKIASPTFSSKNLHNFVTIFAEQSCIMVSQLESVARNEVISVWTYATNYTLDSVCETVLGVKLNAQINSAQKLLMAFDAIGKLTAQRMMQPWLYPNMLYRLLPRHIEFRENKKILQDFVNEIIISKRNSLKNTDKDESGTEKVKSFLDLLIEASGGDRGYSNLELLEETLVLLFAGTDTSAVGISFAICMMANHPDVQEKVFEELRKVFGESDRPVHPQDLPRLKYLDAVIKETLRLYPPVPVVVRAVDVDTKMPSGVTLRKGSAVTVHIWGTHRNPAYWGADAEQFRPERFIEAPLKYPAAFIPFSCGPRNCLGYQYAMMSMKTALATFLRSYRVLHAYDSAKPLTLTFDVMMKDADGFKVKLIKRTTSQLS